MVSHSAPTQIADPKPIDISEYLFPWRDEQPVLVRIAGFDRLCLPVFATEEALRTLMQRCQIPFERIKRIRDAREFLGSLPEDIDVIADAHFVIGGAIRYMQVVRDAAPQS